MKRLSIQGQAEGTCTTKAYQHKWSNDELRALEWLDHQSDAVIRKVRSDGFEKASKELLAKWYQGPGKGTPQSINVKSMWIMLEEFMKEKGYHMFPDGASVYVG